MEKQPNELHVEIKQVYGIDRVYPVCEQAKALARLAGGVTLTDRAIQSAKELGFKIIVVQQKREL